MAARLSRLRLLRDGTVRGWIEANARALTACADLLTPEAHAVVEGYLAAPRTAGMARARALASLGLHRQSGTGPVAAALLGLI
jgi:hypothetical protein